MDELKQKLIDYAGNNPAIFSIKDADINSALESIYPEVDMGTTQLTKKKRAGLYLIGNEPVCETCGCGLSDRPNWRKSNTTPERSTPYWSWPRTCSASCNQKLIESTGVRRKTFIAKFGVDNPMKLPEISETAVSRRQTDWRKAGINQSRRKLIEGGGDANIINQLKLDITDKDSCEHDAEVMKSVGDALTDTLGRKATREDICNATGIKKAKLDRIFANSDVHYMAFRSPKNTSRGAMEVYDFISGFVSAKLNDWSLTKYEIDVFVPSKNIGIEYNGAWCHSELMGKDKLYHLGKTELAESNGIKLFHIIDWEWDDPIKREIWKSIIKTSLGFADRKLYARSCRVEPVTSPIARKFMDENHLSGFAGASHHIALVLGDEIVMMLSYGQSRFDSTTEVIRIATKLNTVVVGGVSRLISKIDASEITCFANRRHSSILNCGYSNCMEYVGSTQPNYFWFEKREYAPISRQQTQKHKLKALIGDSFDPAKTESENMFSAGYDRIWDCGNLKFALTK